MKYRDARHYREGALVEILWSDARAGEDGWRSPDALNGLVPTKIRSVGYLHHVTRKALVYGNDIADDESVHTSGVIPLGCIRHIRILDP